jgi:hypothetical protein
VECSAEEGLFSPALCLEARGGTGQCDGSRERQEQAPVPPQQTAPDWGPSCGRLLVDFENPRNPQTTKPRMAAAGRGEVKA